MNDKINVMRFLLRDYKWPVAIYYLVLAIIIFGIIIIDSQIDIKVFNQFGIGGSTIIFLFICGLNSFKDNFRFMQTFNVTRKNFLIGSLYAFLIIAFTMAIVEVILNQLLGIFFTYEGYYEAVYGSNNIINDFLWSFSFLIFALTFGFFTTILYYICDNLMKVVVSLIPVLVILIISYINEIYHGRVEIDDFMIGNPSNPYFVVVNLIIASGLFTVFTYLMLRRITVKD